MTKILDGIVQVNHEELKKHLESKNSIVIDVRELEEYVEAHIPGLPLIPMSEIAELVNLFDKDRNYVFVCRSGRRSQIVSQFFKDNGIENVMNYQGGMLEWSGETSPGEEFIIKDVNQLYTNEEE